MVVSDVATATKAENIHFGNHSDEIWSWNLVSVAERARKRMGWSVDFAALVEREYRRFMALGAITTGTTLGMCGPVDEFWHEHILYTRDYAAFCSAVAGKFIHHEPAQASLNPSARSYQLTLDLLELHFGSVSYDIWPSVANFNCGTDNCAMCDKVDSEEVIH